jgi:hypothetical protein
VDKSPLEHLGEAMRGAAVLIGGALLGVGALVLLKGRK